MVPISTAEAHPSNIKENIFQVLLNFHGPLRETNKTDRVPSRTKLFVFT